MIASKNVFSIYGEIFFFLYSNGGSFLTISTDNIYCLQGAAIDSSERLLVLNRQTKTPPSEALPR